MTRGRIGAAFWADSPPPRGRLDEHRVLAPRVPAASISNVLQSLRLPREVDELGGSFSAPLCRRGVTKRWGPVSCG